jgi:uncharacterized protein YjbI with pentapeptide repeats
MKSSTLAIVTSLSALIVLPVQAENLDHVRTLLATKQCPQCDLSNSGLVFAKLANANLSQANLSGANLSRADLSGADLRQANLTGATLFGANLTGAKLDGAILTMADLRSAYLVGATYEGASLENVQLQGAIGLARTAGNADDFYRWALEDLQKKEFNRAIDNFTQTLNRQPDRGQAYFGRSIAFAQLGDKDRAIADAKQAEKLFIAQGNVKGIEVAQAFVKEMETPPPKPQKGGNGIGTALLGIAGAALQIFLGLSGFGLGI